CLFSCYAEASDALAHVVRAAAEKAGTGPARVVAAINAYVVALDAGGPPRAAPPAAEKAGPGPARVVAAINAYVVALDAGGPLVAAMLSEIQATGGARRQLPPGREQHISA